MGLTLLVAGPAAAMKFNGRAMVGQHYDGDTMANEYYLMVSKADLATYVQQTLRNVKVKKLSTQSQAAEANLFTFDNDLTNEKAFGSLGADDFHFFKIEDFVGSKFEKKRDKSFAKLEKKLLRRDAKENNLKFKEVKNNPLFDRTEWEIWSSDLAQQYFNKKKFFKAKFTAADGTKLSAKIPMTFFLNSSHSATRVVSIPEPTTLLLLGLGLIGLAGVKKRFKK